MHLQIVTVLGALVTPVVRKKKLAMSKALSGLSREQARTYLVGEVKALYEPAEPSVVREKIAQLEPLASSFPERAPSVLLGARLAAAELEVDPDDPFARERLDEAIVAGFSLDMSNQFAAVLKKIFNLLCALGLLSQARNTAETLAAVSREHTVASTNLVDVLTDIGIVLSRVNLPGAALTLLMAALAHCRQYADRIPPYIIANCLQCCAWEAVDVGRFEEALGYAEESLAIRIRSRNKNRLYSAYGVVAGIQEKMGLLADCLANYKIATDLARERRLTPSSCTVVLNEAVAMLLSGRYEEAEAGFMEVERIRGFPPLSKGQTVLLNMPELHFLQGKKELALKEIEEILALYEDDKEEKPLYRTYMIYGDILSDAGRLDDALKAYDEAIEVIHLVMGGNEKLLGEVLIGIGRALAHVEKWQDAEHQLAEGCRLMAKMTDRGHPRLAIGLRELAKALVRLGQDQAAFERASEALAMTELIFGSLHEETLQSRAVAETCSALSHSL